MKIKSMSSLFVLLLSAFACGFPSAAPAEPTVNALPPTPDLPFTSNTSPAPLATDAPDETPFAGIWTGPDPDDGSVVTVSIVQTGSNLTGTFSDTFSGSVPPPGFTGNGTGTVLSPTSAQATFDLTRASDNKTVQVQFDLTLSNGNKTLTITPAGGTPIILQRQ